MVREFGSPYWRLAVNFLINVVHFLFDLLLKSWAFYTSVLIISILNKNVYKMKTTFSNSENPRSQIKIYIFGAVEITSLWQCFQSSRLACTKNVQFAICLLT